MATYKVLQDIEAEDKFLGPLTLKQFIFAAITVISGYLTFFFLSKNLWYLAIPLIPIIIFCGFLAVPWGRDQPTEIWLLAKLRFYFKPRKRVWNQTGLQQLVRITVPKKVEEHLTDDLDQNEVKSRLRALADTIDSRGWAVKNVNVNLYTQPGYVTDDPTSDRLIDLSSLPQVSTTMRNTPNISDSDDIFDSPTASHVDAQLSQSAQQRKSSVVQSIDDVRNPDPTPKPDYWFMNQPTGKTPSPTNNNDDGDEEENEFYQSQIVRPGAALDENLPKSMRRAEAESEEDKVSLEKSHQRKQRDQSFSHRHKVLTSKELAAQQAALPPLTNPPRPDILNLARDNNRNVSSLAREAQQMTPQQPADDDDDEVVISLH